MVSESLYTSHNTSSYPRHGALTQLSIMIVPKPSFLEKQIILYNILMFHFINIFIHHISVYYTILGQEKQLHYNATEIGLSDYIIAGILYSTRIKSISPNVFQNNIYVQ